MKAISIILVVSLLFILLSPTYAQNSEGVRLYLKNGSIIIGTIIELLPNRSVKIRTSDGSIFVFKMDEVDRIEKTQDQEDISVNRNPFNTHKIISGIGFGTAWLVTAVASLAKNDAVSGTTIIPVVGPFISMARIENSSTIFYSRDGKALLIVSGAVQTGFCVYFIYSLIRGHSYNKKFKITPAFGYPGLTINFSF